MNQDSVYTDCRTAWYRLAWAASLYPFSGWQWAGSTLAATGEAAVVYKQRAAWHVRIPCSGYKGGGGLARR